MEGPRGPRLRGPRSKDRWNQGKRGRDLERQEALRGDGYASPCGHRREPGEGCTWRERSGQVRTRLCKEGRPRQREARVREDRGSKRFDDKE